MASSILRRFSACCSSREKVGILVSLVTPSTRVAISSPNSRRRVGKIDLGILHHVMQQGGGHRFGIHAQLDEDDGHADGVAYVGLARTPGLPLVGTPGKFESFLNQLNVIGFVAPLGRLDELLPRHIADRRDRTAQLFPGGDVGQGRDARVGRLIGWGAAVQGVRRSVFRHRLRGVFLGWLRMFIVPMDHMLSFPAPPCLAQSPLTCFLNAAARAVSIGARSPRCFLHRSRAGDCMGARLVVRRFTQSVQPLQYRR